MKTIAVGWVKPAFCLMALFAGAGRAFAADVEGQVALPNRGMARDAVVYLQGEAKAVPLSKAIIDQRDKMFSPHVSCVTRGTTMQFPNNDTVFHNVFAYFDASKFDLGMYPRGASKSIKMEKIGVVALLCNVHSDMSAYIVVVDTPFYAVTDKQGRFVLKDVPPGSYTLHVWHESGAKLTQSFAVTAAMKPVTLSLMRR